MIAILLAAGMGRRLGEMGRDIPKCLIRIEDRTLLARHFAAFAACGVERVRVVTGFQSESVARALDAIRGYPGQVELVFNERYELGNVVSLEVGLEGLDDREPLLVMDADVLYPKALLRRLIEAPNPTCLLVDAGSSFTGEEMMVAVLGGRALRVTRHVPPGAWDVLGETVGFLKLAGGHVPGLRMATQALIAAGRDRAQYEEAYDEFFAPSFPIGYALVDGLPWTEIDFPEDIDRARDLILPLVQRIDEQEEV